MKAAFVILAITLGLALAYVDSRPQWDDTAVTAFAMLVSCATYGAAFRIPPWLAALAIGIWIPLYGIVTTRNYGALLALVFAFAGAYAGFGLRKMLAT